ncbi:MAG: repair ATPase [Thermosipho sp. (in: Bacteria)]|nr:repair ATPase [Thermosipho sp. (in: thermotogales)]
MTAVVDDKVISDILSNKKSFFEGKYLTFVPVDEDLSEISWDSQDHNVRKVIFQKSDGFFSSNQKTKEFGLGHKHLSIENFLMEFKSLKPCIWGSDAHSFDKLFEPEQKRYTWIKADPTFEGLKQIIYEPEERIYIGEEPPHKIERNKIIKTITMSNSNNWFEDRSIPLNEGLISIIGGKGTGKTAILDLIAYATGSYRCYEEDENKSKSFLKKAYKEMKDTKIKVEWEDGSSDEKEIGEKLEEINKEGKVRYLPQDYVDQLCSELGKSELESQIEDIIFQKIPAESKAMYTNFRSYKDDHLQVINDKKRRVARQIEDKNSEIYEYRLLIKSKSSKNEDKKKIEGEIKKFEDEIKKITEGVKDSQEQTKILNNLKSFTDQKSKLEKTISHLRTNLLKIEEIENDTSTFIENIEEFSDKLKRGLKDIGVKQEDIKKLKVFLYRENLEEVLQLLNGRKEEIKQEIKKQETELDKIKVYIKELNNKIELEKTKQDKFKEINNSLSELKKKKDSLNEDIKKIEDAEKELPKLLENREKLFIKYFEIIFEEKKELKEIYSPLVNSLQESGEENKKLFDFTVQFDFDINTMAKEGHELIDLRADGMFRQSRQEVLREELEKLKFRLNLDDVEFPEVDSKNIKGFLKKVQELFTKDGRTIISQLKEKNIQRKILIIGFILQNIIA